MIALSLQLEDAGQHSPIQATAEGSWEHEMMPGTTTYAESAHSDIGVDSQEEGQQMDPGEQAAVGRLSSMSLIAAVVTGGTSQGAPPTRSQSPHHPTVPLQQALYTP
jgi:serine/threonine-protein phosphatase 4 regulatory subunit 1